MKRLLLIPFLLLSVDSREIPVFTSRVKMVREEKSLSVPVFRIDQRDREVTLWLVDPNNLPRLAVGDVFKLEATYGNTIVRELNCELIELGDDYIRLRFIARM